MHRAARLFALLPVVLVAAHAQTPGNAPAGRTSPRLTALIRSTLPEYDPSAAHRAERLPLDPDVAALPEMTVNEPPAPRSDPDDWIARKELNRRLKRDYLDAQSPVERLLNGWSIPRLTPSVLGRARHEYETRRLDAEIDRLNTLADGVGELDPKAATELRHQITAMQRGQPPPR